MAVEWLVGIAGSYVLFRQLKVILDGPLPMRLSAARMLISTLMAAWVLLPSATPVTIPGSRLALYPLTLAQKGIFSILSILQNRRITAVLAASLVSILVMARLPHSLMAMAEAATALTVTAGVGVGCAIALQSLQIGTRHMRGNELKWRRFPLLCKELRCYLRTLDFYLAFFISTGAGLSELFGDWMSPAKAALPLLLLAMLQMPAILNPFGLETPPQLDRYHLLPTPYWKLLFGKHIALAMLFLASTVPVAAALICRMPFVESCSSAAVLCLVLMSWLVTGLLLMRLPSARQIRVAFGAISGNDMSALLVIQSAMMMAAVPVAAAVAMRSLSPVGGSLTTFGLLCFMIAVYVWSLRKQDWPVDLSVSQECKV